MYVFHYNCMTTWQSVASVATWSSINSSVRCTRVGLRPPDSPDLSGSILASKDFCWWLHHRQYLTLYKLINRYKQIICFESTVNLWGVCQINLEWCIPGDVFGKIQLCLSAAYVIWLWQLNSSRWLWLDGIDRTSCVPFSGTEMSPEQSILLRTCYFNVTCVMYRAR